MAGPAGYVDDFEGPNIWERLGVQCGGYNSVIDAQIVGAAKLIVAARLARTSLYVDDIAKRLGISNEHAELIQYLLASIRYGAGAKCPFDYGTSPRGLFVGDMACAERFIAECDEYMKRWT